MTYILVTPVVEVMAVPTRVSPGGTVTLTCTVTRGSSVQNTFLWTYQNTALPGEMSATLRLSSFNTDDVGIYSCEVMNEVGVGRDSITLNLGGEALLLLYSVLISFHSFFRCSLTLYINLLCCGVYGNLSV